MRDTFLRNGMVLSADGPERRDIAIRDGLITAIAPQLESTSLGIDAVEFDCTGAWVGPGFVDIHAHLREPGQEWKEDIESGSLAAAAGGYTALIAMPNTDPAIDSAHLVRYVSERGRQVGLVDLAASGCVSAGRRGQELAHLDDLWLAGVRIYTDDGDVVADAGLLLRAMEYLAQLGGVLAQHAIDPGLARHGHMHEGKVASRLGMTAIPSVAETVVIARDLELVRLTGCNYHIQHISAAAALDLLADAKREGLPVTAEVTPHHLAFSEEDVAGTDPAFKMMPPLRSTADREALVEGLRSGVIDVVATDHAPHADHEKDVPFEFAPNGVLGLEWAAAVVNDRVALDPVRFFEVLSVAPAKIAKLGSHGIWPSAGCEANLVVFDPSHVGSISGRSKSRNAPHLGQRYRGRVRATFLRGEPTYQAGEVI